MLSAVLPELVFMASAILPYRCSETRAAHAKPANNSTFRISSGSCMPPRRDSNSWRRCVSVVTRSTEPVSHLSKYSRDIVTSAIKTMKSLTGTCVVITRNRWVRYSTVKPMYLISFERGSARYMNSRAAQSRTPAMMLTTRGTTWILPFANAKMKLIMKRRCMRCTNKMDRPLARFTNSTIPPLIIFTSLLYYIIT